MKPDDMSDRNQQRLHFTLGMALHPNRYNIGEFEAEVEEKDDMDLSNE